MISSAQTPFSIDQTALLIIDMQEKVFAAMDRGGETLRAVHQAIQSFQALDRPLFITEQYPDGLGGTLPSIKTLMGTSYIPLVKTAFSCLDDPKINAEFLKLPFKQWVLIGIEAHICVLQTAKGLKRLGKNVAVLADATTSRSKDQYAIGLSEMRDCGIRITSVESLLFELIQDSKNEKFKLISRIIK
ncbi:MAG: isochorismatase family protein [Parachlamydia sp.]|jgi:nicotinamidase-related amidase|nr:isochorismatase family protein [Parachlamydia sp.]